MGPPPPNGTASPAGPGPNSGDPYGRPGWGQYGPRPGYPPQSGHPPPPSGPPTSSSGPPFGSSGPGGPYPDQYHVSRQLSSSSSWLSVFFGFECRPDFCAGFCTFVHSLFPRRYRISSLLHKSVTMCVLNVPSQKPLGAPGGPPPPGAPPGGPPGGPAPMGGTPMTATPPPPPQSQGPPVRPPPPSSPAGGKPQMAPSIGGPPGPIRPPPPQVRSAPCLSSIIIYRSPFFLLSSKQKYHFGIKSQNYQTATFAF